ncbi:hypothetical protein F5Y07DRAFT_382405 [Xylaria sp. FL0933]|nr:hypothetical protein F5Y07DRAFT_382405 [Xylaria sp. FL0933]
MCYYQNIHCAHHHVLLGFDARERERHSCAFGYPTWYRGQGDAKCPLHSCCRVKRVVVLRCGDSPGDAVEGFDKRVDLEDEKLCPVAFSEDVFVPIPPEKDGVRPVLKCGESESEKKVRFGAERIHRDGDNDIDGSGFADGTGGSVILEFWSDDGERIVIMALADEDLDWEKSEAADQPADRRPSRGCWWPWRWNRRG